MRARLVVVLTIPILAVFGVLGAGYAGNVVWSGQQELFLDRLSDASYLVLTARQSLVADDPSVVADELTRYGEVYDIGATVLDRSGELWATNGLDVTALDERFTALAGRRADLSRAWLPWNIGDIVVAEPVFEDGDLVGVVVTSSGSERLVRDIALHWSVLGLLGLLALGLSVLLATRLAGWVLRPVRMVDTAMAEIGLGHMEARIPESSGPPELRHVVGQFNQMAEKVERLMHKQQEFVSNASHELRNPLNALLLRVEDLGIALSDERHNEIEHVREEGRRMTRILDALLMLARDQDVGTATEPIDVVAAVAGRIDEWRPLAGARNLELTLDGLDQAWSAVDATVIESAFDAVIDNAIKFSPSGERVEVTVTERDGQVEIAIRDHGPGLPPEELDKVTDRFWRSPRHRSVRGSGLGLAIGSEMLDACGGGLAVAGADGGGLVVSLRVPGGRGTS